MYELGKFFPSHQQSSQNIKFTMVEESNRKLVFLDTLLKQSNGKISVLFVVKETYTY